eukprot:6352420-Lingulodinium_polyedra.AAC.1
MGHGPVPPPIAPPQKRGPGATSAAASRPRRHEPPTLGPADPTTRGKWQRPPTDLRVDHLVVLVQTKELRAAN